MISWIVGHGWSKAQFSSFIAACEVRPAAGVQHSPAAARETCVPSAKIPAPYGGCFMRSLDPLFVPSLFAPFSMMTRL